MLLKSILHMAVMYLEYAYPGSTFSSVRRKQEGSNANDRITVMPTTLKGEHDSPSGVLQEWSWKSLNKDWSGSEWFFRDPVTTP